MVAHPTCLVKLSVKGVQIEPDVYSTSSKSTHACIVISCRVYVIDPYGIRPQICHGGRVEHALSCIGERVEGGQLVGNACGWCQRDGAGLMGWKLTFDVILGSIGEEELGSNGRNSGHVCSGNHTDGC